MMKISEPEVYLPEDDDALNAYPDDSMADAPLDADTIDDAPADMTEDYIDPEEIEEIRSEAESYRSADDMVKALAQEGLAVDDPVRMYLKEIGQIPLVTQEEIEMKKKSHFGLSLMRERITVLNGEVELCSGADGTKIEIKIPVKEDLIIR